MQKYDPKVIEPEILDFWKKNKVFDKLRSKLKGKKVFSFIDGPITANNPMGVHHAWGRTYKDVFQRFKAMQGFDQRFQNGFDCQGLWVEVEVEKDLGFNSKKDIENYGLDKFSTACRKRVEKYSKIQTGQSIRLGQWMDWENSYYTMHDNNIEHIWHFLKVCHNNGWLYQGTRPMPWCYRCGTSLSQHELIDSYQELTHKSVYIALPIMGKKDHYFLVWTTTPWTLTSNIALAVNPGINYSLVKKDASFYYIAEKLLSKIGGDYIVIDTVPGKELLDLEYQGPFDELPAQSGIKHRVIKWSDVGEDEGTGIVHIAPGCGAEDFELSKKEGLEVISPLDEAGDYIDGFGEFTGKNVSKARDLIFESLDKKGFLFKTENYKHRYPSCWRCKEELVFRLETEWFISSKEIRPKMKKAAKKVFWHPDHGGKLMQDWLDNMGDWCISRKRFWGLPLPFWSCSCGHVEIVGSVKDLKKLAVSGFKNLKELHRPWIDDVVIKCPKCNSKATRIKDVGDCWLDAGIVPFSTLNYLNDKKYWNKWFPAEFITEMREQIRLWFYSMLFMSVTLENKTPYQNVLVYEKVHDKDGRPMHKSWGNAIWFDDAVETIGADVMRWMYVSQNPGFNLNFGYEVGNEVLKILKVIWNLANYVDMYTKDGSKSLDDSPKSKWILSRLESTKKEFLDSMEKLQPNKALNSLHQFLIYDLSRSYGQFIREDLSQKSVQNVLRLCFKEAITMLSPICPFMCEKIYQEIFKKEKSIFLESWPKLYKDRIDNKLESEMVKALEIIQEILSKREKAQIGVRWPLAKATINCPDKEASRAVKNLKDIIKKQTNLKDVVAKSSKSFKVTLDTKLTKELELEGFSREITRKIQSLRKKAGLNKEDHIEAFIVCNLDNLESIAQDISSKVGAKKIYFEKKNFKFVDDKNIKDKKFKIGIKKV